MLLRRKVLGTVHREVLNGLVDVEEAAGQMKDALEARKKELSEAAEAKRAEFDRQLPPRWEERSRRLEERMEKEKREELEGLLQRNETGRWTDFSVNMTRSMEGSRIRMSRPSKA